MVDICSQHNFSSINVSEFLWRHFKHWCWCQITREYIDPEQWCISTVRNCSALLADTMVTTDSFLSVLCNQPDNKELYIYDMDGPSKHNEVLRRHRVWVDGDVQLSCVDSITSTLLQHPLWLDQVSAAQDVVRQFIPRLIHFLLNCSPNLKCNLSFPCESDCFALLYLKRWGYIFMLSFFAPWLT